MYLLSSPILATGRGCEMVKIIASFLVSVAAGIACHYICKWLDRDDEDNQPEKE